MHPNDLGHRDGDHPVRIRLTELSLFGEGKVGERLEARDLGYSRQLRPPERDVDLTKPIDEGSEPIPLQATQCGPVEGLDLWKEHRDRSLRIGSHRGAIDGVASSRASGSTTDAMQPQ